MTPRKDRRIVRTYCTRNGSCVGRAPANVAMEPKHAKARLAGKVVQTYTDDLVSCPDPTLSQGIGSGDHLALSWLCRVSTLSSEQANEIAQCQINIYTS